MNSPTPWSITFSGRDHLASMGLTVVALLIVCLANFQQSITLTGTTTNSVIDAKIPQVDILSTNNKTLHDILAKAVAMQTGPVAANSATGTVFSGRPFRSFNSEHRRVAAMFEESKHSPDDSSWFRLSGKSKQCTKWSVVTTINGPSEAVISVGKIPDWCTVIIADTKTPTDYLAQATEWTEKDRERVHYVSVEQQREWQARQGPVAEFIKAIPYRHFARKNIGYLYAIHRGAKLIYDFDDDNILLLDKNGKSLYPLADEEFLRGARIVATGMVPFNHHHLMGATEPDSWARGFPLSLIRNNHTRGFEAFRQDISLEKMAVIQFCANTNPDIDAIHRLTKPLPMYFDPHAAPVIVPPHALAPYNAQATVHTAQAAFALLLPSTVPGRVSDIWRSYFAQALFRPLDLRVGFVAPRVWQDRNAHDYMADFQAEADLYHKTDALLDFLSTWQSTSPHVATRMEELWIDLYERGYIELEEVASLQHWLAALIAIDYSFPTPWKRRYDNVVLMGQFNEPPTTSDVIFWAQKWKEVFSRIVIRGALTDQAVEDLRASGIDAYISSSEEGRYSPDQNLAETLKDSTDIHGVDGVIYLSNDALLNMTYLVPTVASTFPSEKVMASFDRHRIKLQEKDPKVPPDFLFVPLRHAEAFASSVSELVHYEKTKNRALDKTIPILVQSMQDKVDSGEEEILERLPLCTRKQEDTKTVAKCLNSDKSFGVFRPAKLSSFGYKKWSRLFDRATFSGAHN